MKKSILLGFEIETGEKVEISPSHMIVTGLTQLAGKTTTLESLIKRSGKRAIVFRTKIGEKSFLSGTKIPPFFKDKSDWQFIQGLVEATIKEKLRSFERAKIIQICKKTGGNSLLDFKKKVDERLEEKKINSFERDILTNLQAYLEIVLPKLQSINFSNELELVDGLNIIDLERFSRDSEVQSLIIRSVVEEVLYNFKDVIIVLPESWKFIPQNRGNPCKQIVEEFIRQGATNGNYLWIDAQNMTSIDKEPLKQVSEYILGYQSEPNEVKKTLDTIPLPKKSKPKPDDIMSLGTGIFYLATRERTIKTYIMPFWLDESTAKKVALGKIKISELDTPQTLTPFKIAVKKPDTVIEKPSIDFQETTKRFNKELNEMRTDFFLKLEEMQEQLNKVYTEIYKLKNKPSEVLDEQTIINKVLQKLPNTPVPSVNPITVDREAIIQEVLARVPISAGTQIFEVSPLEAIKKKFLEEAKKRIMDRINELPEQMKKVIKWMESRQKQASRIEIYQKGLGYRGNYAGRGVFDKGITDLIGKEILKKEKSWLYPNLKELIKKELEPNHAKEEDIELLYNHILNDLLNSNGNREKN